MSLVIGTTYRYGRPYGPDPAVRDGLPNFFYETRADHLPNLLLERGISPPQEVAGPDGVRLPLVCIRTSPHKARDEAIPWHDLFDLDLGTVTYYGDNRPGQGRAEDATGNAHLLEQATLHLSHSPEDRRRAAPLLVFRSVEHDGRVKGQVRFEGLAVIETCEKLLQTDRDGNRYDNYRYRLGMLDLAADGYSVSRAWLGDRRNPLLAHSLANRHAPGVWVDWVTGTSLDLIRATLRSNRPHRVNAPSFDADHQAVLERLRLRYGLRPDSFTLVAAAVTEYLIRSAGHDYRTARVDTDTQTFLGELRMGVSTIGDRIGVTGVVDHSRGPTRLSPTAARASAAVGGVSVLVTPEVVPARDHPLFDLPLVVDGRRLAQLLLHLTRNQATPIDLLLERLETRPSSVIGAALRGQANEEL